MLSGFASQVLYSLWLRSGAFEPEGKKRVLRNKKMHGLLLASVSLHRTSGPEAIEAFVSQLEVLQMEFKNEIDSYYFLAKVTSVLGT
jgi:hypothetical protein